MGIVGKVISQTPRSLKIKERDKKEQKTVEDQNVYINP